MRTSLRAPAHAINRLAAGILSPPWLEIATFFLLGSMYLYNAWRFTYPAGYAGLYALMAEILAQKPFPLPMDIPYYGPGGIPFAYPPVAAYIAAGFIGPLRVPVFAYLRWEPAVVCILTMLGVYLLGRQLSGDRLKALVGVVVIFSAETFYSYHGTASGSVRGIALLWTVLATYSALLAYTRARRWIAHALLAGVFLALTLMTHLSYAAFVAPGIVLMALFAADGRSLLDRGRTLVVIAGVGALLSAPWWGTVIARYGPEVFFNAGATHGTGGLVAEVGASPFALARAILRWYANLGRIWWPPFLAGLSVLGFAYGLMRGRWLLPAWAVVAVAALGQTDRFEILLCGLLAGELLVDLAHYAAHVTRWPMAIGRETVGGLVFMALALGPIVALGFRGIQWTEVELTEDLVDVGRWVEQHTPEGAQYLYLGGSHDVGEWLPFLAHRTPGVSPWGAEWTGRYDEQLQRLGELSACVEAQEISCVEAFNASVGGEITLLIVPVGDGSSWPALAQHPAWGQGFENGGFRVYQRRD